MIRNTIATSLLTLVASLAFAQDNAQSPEMTPLENFIDGYPLDLAERAISAPFVTWLAGGDEAAYFQMRTSEILPTALIPRRNPIMPLGQALMPQIGSIEAETINTGTVTLDQYLAMSESRSQAYIVVHNGQIVYESYPRMRPTDSHAWMSNAKPTASLLVELLMDEGMIDQTRSIADYVSEFKGTAWEEVTVEQVMMMDSGLDIDDTAETRLQPDSHATRLYLAEFNQPYNGEVERLMDVLASAEPGDGPGQKYVYASAHTQALVVLVEAVTGERWSETFDRLVWSKMGVEGPLEVQTTPDGIALAHGVIGSRLRDMARFGMLYTPSWSTIATEQVVTDEILDRIQNDVRSREFLLAGEVGPQMMNYLDADFLGAGTSDIKGSSRQWDVVWPDGDFWKGGMQTQGLYVSPSRNLVIGYFSTNTVDHSLHRWTRTIATSGLFD